MRTGITQRHPLNGKVGSGVPDRPRPSFSGIRRNERQKTFAARPEAAALPTSRARKHTSAGFSLTEVTISVGIIAAVLLPLIAMLAGSSGTVVRSKDRFAATHLARSIEGQFRYSRKEDSFVLEGSSTQQGRVNHVTLLNPPGPGGSTHAYLGYDRAARFVRKIEKGEFKAGLDPSEEEVFYLTDIEIASSSDGFSTSLDAPSLYRVTISVGQPAFTAPENRTVETLTTLVSAQ